MNQTQAGKDTPTWIFNHRLVQLLLMLHAVQIWNQNVVGTRNKTSQCVMRPACSFFFCLFHNPWPSMDKGTQLIPKTRLSYFKNNIVYIDIFERSLKSFVDEEKYPSSRHVSLLSDAVRKIVENRSPMLKATNWKKCCQSLLSPF